MLQSFFSVVCISFPDTRYGTHTGGLAGVDHNLYLLVETMIPLQGEPENEAKFMTQLYGFLSVVAEYPAST